MKILRTEVLAHADGREVSMCEWEDGSWTFKDWVGTQYHHNPTTRETYRLHDDATDMWELVTESMGDLLARLLQVS